MPATIRLGSKGKDVATWQRILGVPESGTFDGSTKEATIDWQKKHKLVPDGVVGPLTWGAATGTGSSASVSVPVSPSVNTDKWAYDIAKRALPSIGERGVQYLVTVARGEGFYGKGWKGAGAGSNNWGAVQGTGNAGSFPHQDHHADGKAYTGTFKKYQTPEDGVKDMAKILLKTNVLNALDAGDLKAAVYAQHSNGYFELNPAKYLEAVQRNYAQLTSNLNWPPALSGSKKTAGMVLVALLAIAGAALIKKGLG